MANLSYFYRYGKGVEVNPVKAKEYYNKAWEIDKRALVSHYGMLYVADSFKSFLKFFLRR